jgi:hypothetical protein
MALTKEEKAEREAHFAEHTECWMCRFLNVQQFGRTQLHHIAGRGKRHEVRANYSALCDGHHASIQSMADAELVCLVLKMLYDLEHCEPETICELRGRAKSCWTMTDIVMCGRVMKIMKEVCK